MASAIKTMVSKNKIRYVSDGYNLDLSYITDRLIAMGFPAQRFESIYRNSSDDVKRFLDEKHPNHYKIYNLCSERMYDKAKFYGRVEEYPFDDHNPPRFTQIQMFCEDVTNWLARDQNNVAAVHCKAGKGRTGVMICCFLLHSKVYGTAREVLDYYGRQRTQNEKGVTIPSQQRYISYYDACLRHRLRYASVKMYLTTVVVDHVPSFGTTDTYYLQFEVHSPKLRRAPFVSDWQPVKAKDRLVRLEVQPPLLVSDDVKIEFSYKGMIKKLLMPPKKEFHFWINTFFFGKEVDDGLAHQASIWNVRGPQPPPPTDDRSDDSNNCCDAAKRTEREQPSDDAKRSEVERKISNESDSGLCKNEPAVIDDAGNHQEEITVGGGGGGDPLSNLMKTTSISDDTLLRVQQQQRLAVSFAANVIDRDASSSSSSTAATKSSSSSTSQNVDYLTSFITERTRHSSVPQTSASSATSASADVSFLSSPESSSDSISRAGGGEPLVCVEGDRLSLRLGKAQIDKACKHRGKVYSPNFNVTLFLVRPKDQADLVDFQLTSTTATTQSRTPLTSQSSGESAMAAALQHQLLSNSSSAACVVGGSDGKSSGEQSSPESSSEEEMTTSGAAVRRFRTSFLPEKRRIASSAQSNPLTPPRLKYVRSASGSGGGGNNDSISSLKTERQKKRTSHNDQAAAAAAAATANNKPQRSSSNVDVIAAAGPRSTTAIPHSSASSQIQFNSFNMMLSSKAAGAVSQTTWI